MTRRTTRRANTLRPAERDHVAVLGPRVDDVAVAYGCEGHPAPRRRALEDAVTADQPKKTIIAALAGDELDDPTTISSWTRTPRSAALEHRRGGRRPKLADGKDGFGARLLDADLFADLRVQNELGQTAAIIVSGPLDDRSAGSAAKKCRRRHRVRGGHRNSAHQERDGRVVLPHGDRRCSSLGSGCVHAYVWRRRPSSRSFQRPTGQPRTPREALIHGVVAGCSSIHVDPRQDGQAEPHQSCCGTRPRLDLVSIELRPTRRRRGSSVA